MGRDAFCTRLDGSIGCPFESFARHDARAGWGDARIVRTDLFLEGNDASAVRVCAPFVRRDAPATRRDALALRAHVSVERSDALAARTDLPAALTDAITFDSSALRERSDAPEN